MKIVCTKCGPVKTVHKEVEGLGHTQIVLHNFKHFGGVIKYVA